MISWSCTPFINKQILIRKKKTNLVRTRPDLSLLDIVMDYD